MKNMDEGNHSNGASCSVRDAIRRSCRKARSAMSGEAVRQESERICRHITASPLYRRAGRIFCYYPMGNEADILPVAHQALADGKEVAFPRVSGEQMAFFKVRELERSFAEGCFHVMEPLGEEELVPGNDGSGSLILVPGVAFDLQGGRTGYGRGYYDRYLAAHNRLVRTGIALRVQLVEHILAQPWDIPMEYLATAEGLMKTGGRAYGSEYIGKTGKGSVPADGDAGYRKEK